jgi:hypothetical protein
VRALHPDPDAVAGRGEGHEDDAAVRRTADAVAAGRELVDRELQQLVRAARSSPARATSRAAPAARLRYRSAPRTCRGRTALASPSIMKRSSAMPGG